MRLPERAPDAAEMERVQAAAKNQTRSSLNQDFARRHILSGDFIPPFKHFANLQTVLPVHSPIEPPIIRGGKVSAVRNQNSCKIASLLLSLHRDDMNRRPTQNCSTINFSTGFEKLACR